MRHTNIYLASKRAPITYTRNPANDQLVAEVAPGGTGNVVADLASYLNVAWFASAMTDDDRDAARANPSGMSITFTSNDPITVYLLEHEKGVFHSMQTVMTSDVLWASNNYLWDSWTNPSFNDDLHKVWKDFQLFSEDFSTQLIARSACDERATYLIHDYQLVCVPGLLRQKRPRQPILLFIHIPWPSADYWRMLPKYLRGEILKGMLGSSVIGFFAKRWVKNFLACVEDCVPEAKVDTAASSVTYAGRSVSIQAMPLGYSSQALNFRKPIVDSSLREWIGDRFLILHSGRTDPMKNAIRALDAFLIAAEREPGLVESRFLIRSNPNRLYVAANRKYFDDLQIRVERANNHFGCEVVRLVSENDVDRTIACIKRADIMFINSTIDGQNLTVFESCLLNERDAGIILSERCGAAEVLEDWCVSINPFDVEEQARALQTSFLASRETRHVEATRRRHVAEQYDLPKWVEQQIASLKEEPFSN